MVSGDYGREQVDFFAPSADTLSDELDKFLSCFDNASIDRKLLEHIKE